ncbi:MAG: DNA/RNA non-specific endonuclease [Pseudomonadota bacterium]|nr:DNA/RNA non-specific endonuclease [Pseudomonadota bacterium]
MKLKSFFLGLFIMAASIAAMADNQCHLHSALGLAKADQILCHQGFVVGYSYEHKQPFWVQAYMTKKSVNGRLKRSNDFREDKTIPSQFRSRLSDFFRSNHDRGHLQSSASVDFSEEAMSESYLLSGISPQIAGFNRQGFKFVESGERGCVNKFQKMISITGSVFGKDAKSIGNGVTVPTAFYKVFFTTTDLGKPMAMALLMPHKAFKRVTREMYVSVDKIEQLTGFDFFHDLPDNVENRIEKSSLPFCHFRSVW